MIVKIDEDNMRNREMGYSSYKLVHSVWERNPESWISKFSSKFWHSVISTKIKAFFCIITSWRITKQSVYKFYQLRPLACSVNQLWWQICCKGITIKPPWRLEFSPVNAPQLYLLTLQKVLPLEVISCSNFPSLCKIPLVLKQRMVEQTEDTNRTAQLSALARVSSKMSFYGDHAGVLRKPVMPYSM